MTDINSPLKPPTMNKDPNNQTAVNGRKTSVSQGAGNAFAVNSPSSASRPGTRRRETLESNPFSAAMNSPSAGRNVRDDPSYWTRKTDLMKESEPDEPESEQGSRDPSRLFGNLLRSNTTGSQGAMGGIWSQSNPGTPGGSAFGNFAIGNPGVASAKPVQGASGGSRLVHLIPTKDTTESTPARQVEGQNPLSQAPWRSRTRTDTDPFGEDMLTGSASLGGAQEPTAVQPQTGRVGTLGTPVKGSTGDFGMSGLNLGSNDDGPASPSETNPFRSPPGANQHDQDEGDVARTGFHHDQAPVFNPLQARSFNQAAGDSHDRSQTSSAKGFALGHMSAWGVPGVPGTATPDRERAAFGGQSFFNNMGDMQSGGLGNLNSVFGPAGTSGMGSIGRGSKLSSLFSGPMQAQMQQNELEGLGESTPDHRQTNPLGAIGRSNFSMPMRDTESPIRSNRGVFEELFPSSDANRAQNMFQSAEPLQPGTTSASYTPVTGGMPFGNAIQTDASAQNRIMVMPDRMRWVYLDPQGQVQGPFTGLEMNDWYKANFFSADLRVKRLEDPEFEPLGQLIRRIGNSREPFLVPQVGIAHGSPSQNTFPPAQPGGVVPPLSGVFPSFGRTLTAEEQNNLERRKQEEQYMMAQQRDFVMRQQALSRFQGQPGLQHHSSAQSLQSQPSFGNIQSPMAMQGMQAPIGAMPPGSGYFDPESQDIPGLSGNGEPSGEEETAHLSATERQMLAALQQSQQQPIGAPSEGALRSGLPGTDQLGEDPEGFKERLIEFEDLRAQHNAEQAVQALADDAELAKAVEAVLEDAAAPVDKPAPPPPRKRKEKKKFTNFADHEDHDLSLTQQVQATQAAAAAAVFPPEPGMPMPFPPPTSTTPLPAPTAQRVRSNLPEQYSRSQSGSPGDDSNAPPPLAPWAKEPGNDSKKGPSLKEIQEAEARKAAKAEELASALRKAALEQEALLLREKEKQAATSAAGLPASSTWGQTASPVSLASPWAKPVAAKAPAPTPSSSSKKTLAEIQAEEEKRKLKAEKAAVQIGIPTGPSKSYANLAGKTGLATASPAPPPGAGWAVVGASGKAKAPPTGPAASRSVSAAGIKAPTPTILKSAARPTPPVAPVATLGAMDEFRKWVNRELSRDLKVDNGTFTPTPINKHHDMKDMY